MVDDDQFRADLCYRLNVFPIRVPSLRDRREDIPQLAEYFLAQMARKLGKVLESVDPLSLERLKGFPWPGNVRELRNLVERAAILPRGPVVSIDDGVVVPDVQEIPPTSSDDRLDSVQRTHIVDVLSQCEWRIEGRNGAAAVLGLKPSTLRYRMQKLGIVKETSRS